MSIDELVNKYEAEVRERSVKKNPQYYHALRNLQWSRCLQAALSNKPLPEDDWSALCGEKPSKSGGSCRIDFGFNPKPGDNVLDALNKARKRTSTPVSDGMHQQYEDALKRNKCHVEGLYVRANVNNVLETGGCAE